MQNAIKKYLLEPLLPRIGTAVAGPMIAYGLNADLSHATGAFVIAGVGLAYDWVAHFVTLRMAKDKAVTNFVNRNAL
ncbi:hypothetical protein [Devosia chinhatensis]|uniref:Uncharacterized protein n=1 Tax=Devosia chinhatensis TaxID=429727 RepID=A0A0F5FKY2_9HYPH|nr:hypothetical protein [Devosia chinhatensis]KKB09524.1 hypothetical protein VE26_06355 [Devosia chinhatensis]